MPARVVSERPLILECPYDDCKHRWQPRKPDPLCCPKCARYLEPYHKILVVKSVERIGKSFIRCEDCKGEATVHDFGKDLCRKCQGNRITKSFSEVGMDSEQKVAKSECNHTDLTKERLEEKEAIDNEGSFDRPRERGSLSRRKDTSTS